MSSPVLPGDPGYDALLSAYQADSGNLVKSGGVTYVAVRDNDLIKFVSTQAQSFEVTYASRVQQPRLDVPMAEKPEPTETGAEKAPRTRTSRKKS